MNLKTALIVGAGPGLSASLARLFARHGLQVALASRNPDKLAKLAEETAGVTFACEATEPEEVAGLFDVVVATQGAPDIVVYNASARARGPGDRPDPGGRRAGDRGQRLWRVPGGAAGGAADGGAWVGGDPADRRFGEREGLSELVGLRDGQVRAARAGVRAWRGSCRRRACMWRISLSMAGSGVRTGPIRTTIRTVRWTRMRSPRPIGRWRTSSAARGRGRWSCGPGWRSSEGGRQAPAGACLASGAEHCDRNDNARSDRFWAGRRRFAGANYSNRIARLPMPATMQYAANGLNAQSSWSRK